MKRTLRLRREDLAELSTDELGELVGAAKPESITCPITECGSRMPTCGPIRDPLDSLVC